jgi:hypothetical protein
VGREAAQAFQRRFSTFTEPAIDRTAPSGPDSSKEVEKVTDKLRKILVVLAPVAVVVLTAAGRIWGG